MSNKRYLKYQIEKEREQSKQENRQKAKQRQKNKPHKQRTPRQKDWYDDVDEPFQANVPAKQNASEASNNLVLEGVVVESSANRCRVLLNGKTLLCTLRGSLSVDVRYTSPVIVGDQVDVVVLDEQRGVVETVHERTNVIARPDPSGTSQMQALAANVDQLLIVAAWRQPHLWPELIDRYLIVAERSEVEPIICVNKIDLLDDQHAFSETLAPYLAEGYTIHQTSVLNGTGIDDLAQQLAGKRTVLAGLSGVGKSSLLSAVQPGFDLRIGTVNEERGQGRHTTTQAVMLPFGEQGAIIDTPGIRSYALSGLLLRDVASFYPEIVRIAGDCYFTDCVHLEEPDCAVKVAVQSGSISQIRYHNYVQICADLRPN